MLSVKSGLPEQGREKGREREGVRGGGVSNATGEDFGEEGGGGFQCYRGRLGGGRAEISPLALAGVFAIITKVDGSGAASWQQGIIGSQDGTPQNLQVLLVAGYAHPHMVRQPHLQANMIG